MSLKRGNPYPNAKAALQALDATFQSIQRKTEEALTL